MKTQAWEKNNFYCNFFCIWCTRDNTKMFNTKMTFRINLCASRGTRVPDNQWSPQMYETMPLYASAVLHVCMCKHGFAQFPTYSWTRLFCCANSSLCILITSFYVCTVHSPSIKGISNLLLNWWSYIHRLWRKKDLLVLSILAGYMVFCAKCGLLDCPLWSV